MAAGGDAGIGGFVPPPHADITTGSGDGSGVQLPISMGGGSAGIDLGSQSGLMSGGATISMPPIPGVGTYGVGMPVSDLSQGAGYGSLTFTTEAGSITIPANMLTGVSGVSGSSAEITIGQGDKASLPDDVRDAIGDRPLVELTLFIDGEQTDWGNSTAPVTVSIPYTPTADERANPESIVIWFINRTGNVITIPSGHYNPATGMVTFHIAHYSSFAVAYNKVDFMDVPSDAWYCNAVNFIASRGITDGTGDEEFSPNANLTRGDFLVQMMNAYGINPDADPADNFSDAGNTYFTGYLAAAKRLRITTGVGNNMYAPDKEITRQEMFALLYNALEAIGQLPQVDSGKALSDFTDADEIAPWASKAMTLFVNTGSVNGSGVMLNPLSTATRAEMAQILYNLLRQKAI